MLLCFLKKWAQTSSVGHTDSSTQVIGDRRVAGIHWPSITAKLMAAGPGKDLVAAGPGGDLSQNTMMGRLQRLSISEHLLFL